MDNRTQISTSSVSSRLDAVQAKLGQAKAVLTMLLNDAGQGRFDSNHDMVLSVLWTTLELVNAARDASQQVFDAYIAEHTALIPPAAPPQP